VSGAGSRAGDATDAGSRVMNGDGDRYPGGDNAGATRRGFRRQVCVYGDDCPYYRNGRCMFIHR
jgi:hypothetical protein